MCKKIETNENFFSLGEILVREISPELLKQESETGDILGCNATGEKILTTTGYGNLNVRSSNLSGREPLIDFARNQIYQRIRRGDSIVIIDPERRLHTREMWIYLTIHGYCVDSYDLDCMDGSCCFNCLSGFDKKLRKEDLDLIQRIANDIDDGESDPWKDKTYEDFYIGGYFISRYEQDAGIYYKNSKGEKIEDAGCNQYMSKKNPYGIQKT